jgi:hypothetical protein
VHDRDLAGGDAGQQPQDVAAGEAGDGDDAVGVTGRPWHASVVARAVGAHHFRVLHEVQVVDGDDLLEVTARGHEVGAVQEIDAAQGQFQRQRDWLVAMMCRRDGADGAHARGQPGDIRVAAVQQDGQATLPLPFQGGQGLHQAARVLRDAGFTVVHQAAIDGDAWGVCEHDYMRTARSCLSSHSLADSPPA